MGKGGWFVGLENPPFKSKGAEICPYSHPLLTPAHPQRLSVPLTTLMTTVKPILGNEVAFKAQNKVKKNPTIAFRGH